MVRLTAVTCVQATAFIGGGQSARDVRQTRPGRVLFGPDWPYPPIDACYFIEGFDDADDAIDRAGQAAINRSNVEALLNA